MHYVAKVRYFPEWKERKMMPPHRFRKTTHRPFLFLSAAQPTDQGEESVVLLVVVIVVVGGGTIFQFPMYSFLGCEKAKLCLKRGVTMQKHCLKRGVKRQKLCLKRVV